MTESEHYVHPNDDDIACPACKCQVLSLTWRTDMTRLEIVDMWKCLKCHERWEVRTGIEQLRQGQEARA